MSEATTSVWDLWVDFHRVDAAGFTHASLQDLAAGERIAEGQFIIVGDDDADPAVAEVIALRPNDVVLLRVLPGHADVHRHLLKPRPA